MVVEQTRADTPRRALLGDPEDRTTPASPRYQKPARVASAADSNWWRRGLALAAVSGIAITALGVFGASNYSTLAQAFANQTSTAPQTIDETRSADTSRSDERPQLSFEELVEQRAKLIAESGAAVTAKVTQTAAETRHGLLAEKAESVEQEAERLRNLGNFLWPTEGGVGSPWGQRLHPILRYYRLHGGADIGGRCGQPIYAAQSGLVTKADSGGYNGGSGNNVKIDHGDINGVQVDTAYLHMSKVVVTVGQKVTKGDLLGNVGSTGLSTACHLHLTLYKNGVNSDPMEYVKRAEGAADEAKEDENSADRELATETPKPKS